jgi:hypothetical protein
MIGDPEPEVRARVGFAAVRAWYPLVLLVLLVLRRWDPGPVIPRRERR